MTDSHSTVDDYLTSLPDWQYQHLEQFRKLIHEVEPDVSETIKWNVPVFVFKGKVLFAMSAFKQHTKYNFIENGALLNDKNDLFNNGLDSIKSRSIDRVEADTIEARKLRGLIAQAIALADSLA